MATADLLVELMFSWIEKRENCAKQLKKLADELETLRGIGNAVKCVGSTMSVIGAASLIGAGVATFFTAGAAAPALAIAGGICKDVGTTVSVTTKIIEHFLSSKTLKDAEKIEEENNEIAERIQNLFQQLKAEVKRMNPSADPDQVDRHVMTSFIHSVATGLGLGNGDKSVGLGLPQLNFNFSQHESFYRTELGIGQNSINPSAMTVGLMIIVCGIFPVFSLRTSGKQSKLWIAEATEKLIKKMSSIGLKTAIKGGAMIVEGAVGLRFALPEAIDNWTDLIKNNHETEASRSMRDTAADILKKCNKVRKQFNHIRTVLEEQEEEESDSEEEDQTIRLGLLNVRSMEKKTGQIKKLIRRNKLDVFLTTETWLKHDNAVTVLSKASPAGFRFHYQVRADGRRGGGVANQFFWKLQGQQLNFNYLNIMTFEFVVTKLKLKGWSQPVVIINLYLPPGYDEKRFRTFLDEFQRLLIEVRKNYSSIIVTGDFNIRPKTGERCYTDAFYVVWWIQNLQQHVTEPTHRGGNILDLVLTTKVEISDLFVQDDGVSDHSTVSFNAKPNDKEQIWFSKSEE